MANGFGDVKPEGVPFALGGLDFRYESTGREGIAVDGSRDNVIRATRLAGNSAGGIFLYKNCGEFATEKPAQWWTRPLRRHRQPDRGQRPLVGGQRRVGRVAHGREPGVHGLLGSHLRAERRRSRASTSTRPTTTPCGATPFEHVRYGVRVEDDGTVVDANTFTSDRADPRGGPRRHEAAHAVPGRAGVGHGPHRQRGRHRRATPSRSRWIHGHVLTTDSGNVASGVPASLVPGTQPTIDPALFVVRFWQVP